jgi:hypothetical protein
LIPKQKNRARHGGLYLKSQLLKKQKYRGSLFQPRQKVSKTLSQLKPGVVMSTCDPSYSGDIGKS